MRPAPVLEVRASVHKHLCCEVPEGELLKMQAPHQIPTSEQAKLIAVMRSRLWAVGVSPPCRGVFISGLSEQEPLSPLPAIGTCFELSPGVTTSRSNCSTMKRKQRA